MTLFLIAGPAEEPVPLAEAKTWMRVEAAGEDDLISALVTSSRLILEASTRRLFVNQQWRVILDAWPADATLDIGLTPFRSLDAIRIFDAAGVPQILAPSAYIADTTPEHPRIKFNSTPPAPGRALAGIEIDLTAGYGANAADVPAPLRQAIKMLAGRWYERRGDAAQDAAVLPAEIAALIAPYKRARLV